MVYKKGELKNAIDMGAPKIFIADTRIINETKRMIEGDDYSGAVKGTCAGWEIGKGIAELTSGQEEKGIVSLAKGISGLFEANKKDKKSSRRLEDLSEYEIINEESYGRKLLILRKK